MDTPNQCTQSLQREKSEGKVQGNTYNSIAKPTLKPSPSTGKAQIFKRIPPAWKPYILSDLSSTSVVSKKDLGRWELKKNKEYICPYFSCLFTPSFYSSLKKGNLTASSVQTQFVPDRMSTSGKQLSVALKPKILIRKPQGRTSVQCTDRHTLEISRLISHFKQAKYTSIQHNLSYYACPCRCFYYREHKFLFRYHTAILNLTNKLPLCQKEKKKEEKMSPRLLGSLSFPTYLRGSKNLPTKHNLLHISCCGHWITDSYWVLGDHCTLCFQQTLWKIYGQQMSHLPQQREMSVVTFVTRHLSGLWRGEWAGW